MKINALYTKLQQIDNVSCEYNFFWILDECFCIHKIDIDDNKILNDEILRPILNRLESGEPLAYIFKYTNFYGRDFFIKSDILIPRLDSEIVVNIFIQKCNTCNVKNIADICCGSGCLGITTALESKIEKCIFLDVNTEAINLTKDNCQKFNINSGLFINDSVFHDQSFLSQIDAFISNPPYVKTSDINNKYESILALDGGEDGLLFYRRLFEIFKTHPNIQFAVLEIGYNQMDNLKKMADDYGLYAIFHRDFGNNWRVCELQR